MLSADRDGARVLRALESRGVRPTPAEVAALGALTSGAQQALRTGGVFPLLPEDYVRALDELEALADGTTPTAAGTGAPQSSGPGTPAASASSVPSGVPSSAAPLTNRQAVAPTASSASSGPLPVVAVVGAVVLVLLIQVLLL